MKRLLLLSLLVLFSSCEKDPIKYTLSVISNPPEGGIVNPATGNYEAGERVTIINQTNNYFTFKNWSGDWTGNTNQIIITMDSDKSIVANFEKLDTDGDGITDDIDLCSNTDTSAAIIGSNGCEVSLFYLADNGVTIKAIDDAQIGMQQEFEGEIYKLVNENQLRQMVDNEEDVRFVVTSKITNFSRLFQFKGYPSGVSRWDVSNATDMSFMFAGFSGFNLDISNWDVSNVTNMKGMFYAIPVDLSQTNSDNEIPLYLPYNSVNGVVWSAIFTQSPSLSPILQPWISSYAGPNSSNVAFELGEAVVNDATSYVTNALTTATTQTYQELAAQLGLPFSVVASGALAAQGIPLLQTAIDQGVSQTLNIIEYRFNIAENIYKGSFNKNISGWDVSKVTDMSYMFYDSKFNQDISNWNVSNVTTMKYMFGRVSNFNQDLTSWNVFNVSICSSFDVNSNTNWSDSNKPNFTNCDPD
ncbi:BspA family leucine-rich repeat surface protein [bacterium]|nr:BspA family leucine-rich repeat surface protein [bacterium]